MKIGIVNEKARKKYRSKHGIPLDSPIDHRAKNQNGSSNPNWHGGKVITKKGYVLVLAPEHPNAGKDGRVFEHVLVLEAKLGRYLLSNECPHHLNEIKTDNRPENLELTTRGKHTILHWTGRHHTEEAKRKISESKREVHAYRD